MSKSSVNPYAPSATVDLENYTSVGHNTHHYAGHAIHVSAGYLPSHLWGISGFTVQTENGECFNPVQNSYNQDFRWVMNIDGAPIECHLQTRRGEFSLFTMPYVLRLGDGPATSHSIRLSGAWCNLLVVSLGLPFLIGIALLIVFLARDAFNTGQPTDAHSAPELSYASQNVHRRPIPLPKDSACLGVSVTPAAR